MKLGVFLAIGESFRDFKNHGQDKLFIDNNLRAYRERFDEIIVFSYENETGYLLPNVKLIPNKWKFHRYLYAFLLPLLHSLEIKKCDVFRGMQFSGGLPALVAKIFYRKKFAINYGYNYVQFSLIERKYLQAFFYKIIEIFMLQFADLIFVPTGSVKKHVKHFTKSDKISMLPNGVDTNKFKPMKVNKKFDILFVGRLERQKNLFFLLDAINKCKQKYKITFIGNGSLKQQLLSYAKKLKASLNVIDSVSHDVLPKYLNKARVFVLPSLAEGHPKALLEALSCSLPVIASDIPGSKDIVVHKETGLLVSPTHVKELSSTIDMVLTNKKLAKNIGDNGRRLILNNYNLKKLFKKEISLLKHLVT